MPATLDDSPAGRKTYILILVEHGEPLLAEVFYTLGDAAAKFRRIMDEDPDFQEDEVGSPSIFLWGAVARAATPSGATMVIVERSL